VRQALLRAFDDESWGKYAGGNVARVEAALATFHGVRHAAACGSGTFAIELALRAVGVEPGDEVLLAGYEFAGAYLSVRAVGATPVLVDVDPENWNLCPEQISGALSPKSRAIIVSHLHGGVVPIRAVREVAASHRVSVIDDVAQCPGAWVEGRRAGTWGDVGVLSFGGSKLLSAGRGGAILTDDTAFDERARAWQLRANVLCPFSELQAAALLPQLEKLDARNAHRATSVRRLSALLSSVPGVRPFANRVRGAVPGYYKLGLRFDHELFGLSRADFVAAVRAEGVAMHEGFGPPYGTDPPDRYRTSGELAEAKRAAEGAVLLHHPVLLGTEEALEEVAVAVAKAWVHRERARDALGGVNTAVSQRGR
jgi:dTDP-4-amino-4,6-dideoxygalactose transaminase